METCRTIEIAPSEAILGRCGRTLCRGRCPVHGAHPPTRWMVESYQAPAVVEERRRVSLQKRIMCRLGLALIAGGVLIFFSPTFWGLGLFIVALGWQVWITAKCWMK